MKKGGGEGRGEKRGRRGERGGGRREERKKRREGRREERREEEEERGREGVDLISNTVVVTYLLVEWSACYCSKLFPSELGEQINNTMS